MAWVVRRMPALLRSFGGGWWLVEYDLCFGGR